MTSQIYKNKINTALNINWIGCLHPKTANYKKKIDEDYSLITNYDFTYFKY
jgi:hypothetical protein